MLVVSHVIAGVRLNRKRRPGDQGTPAIGTTFPAAKNIVQCPYYLYLLPTYFLPLPYSCRYRIGMCVLASVFTYLGRYASC